MRNLIGAGTALLAVPVVSWAMPGAAGSLLALVFYTGIAAAWATAMVLSHRWLRHRTEPLPTHHPPLGHVDALPPAPVALGQLVASVKGSLLWWAPQACRHILARALIQRGWQEHPGRRGTFDPPAWGKRLGRSS